MHASRQQRQREAAVELGGHGERHRVDTSDHVPIVEGRLRVVHRRNLFGARAVRVDDGDELCAWQRRQNPRVMATEMANADDGYSQRHRCSESPAHHEGTKAREGHVAILKYNTLPRDLRARRDSVKGRWGNQRRVGGRPTMQMPASSAAWITASPSISSVLPASIESAVAPTAAIASIVET